MSSPDHPQPASSWLRSWPAVPTWSRHAGLVGIFVPTLLLALQAIRGVYDKLGHPGATLDDSFIHFQYARALAEGHPFRYQAGEPMTTGATSLLWSSLLAPFYMIGFRGEAILWPAWLLSFIALGLLAHEAFHLTRRLAGTAAATGAAAMVLAFSAFTWCAASGMEVVPFAWVLARAARRSSEWVESRSPGDGARPEAPPRSELIVLALVAPLLRPEGALASLMLAAALIVTPSRPDRRDRLLGLTLAGAPLVPFAISFAVTGSARSSTALVKLMVGNPYFGGTALRDAIFKNVRVLAGTILNGEVWSAEFLPHGGALVAFAGLLSLVFCGWQTKARWRAACVLLLALSMAIPCTYVTFLWNRLRYLWPFATGWLIGLACLAQVMGEAAAAVRPRGRLLGPILCGLFAGMLASKLGWTLDDVADSASAIDRQQATMGRWAAANLPAEARIGVNDTGAIGYFSDRRTFDIVGLTTRDEARYWIAGVASRFEHYERMYERERGALPTHFVVYPEWMGFDAVFGRQLFEAVVTDGSILGGTTMRAYEADYSLLGTGEHPWTPTGEPLDTLDVADLESERAHGYELLGARDGEEIVRADVSPDGRTRVDGARTQRYAERFFVTLVPGKAARGLVRLEARGPTQVTVAARGTKVGEIELLRDGWVESEFHVPAGADARTTIELQAPGTVAVYHYWFSSEP